MLVAQNIKNAMNKIYYYLFDSYENIKSIQSNGNSVDTHFVGFLKNSKYFEDSCDIKDFINILFF